MLCPLCEKEVSTILLMAHIPQCYWEKCNSIGIVPLCTCNKCQGKKPHGEEDEKKEEEKRKEEKLEEIKEDIPPSRWFGKACLLCGTKRSPSNCVVPIIFIGKHSRVLLCRKQHFNDKTTDAPQLISLLDGQVESI